MKALGRLFASGAGTALLALAAGFGFAAPAGAHHAFAAEFDVNRPVEMRGTVTKVELINPHSWIHLEVTSEDGASAAWMIEGGSPNALFKQGVTRDSIPIGAELVVSGYQARDGSNRAVGRTLAFADGRPLFFVGTPAPAAPR